MRLPDTAAGQLPDESSWVDGRPSERALIALFAAMSPEALDRFLRDLLTRVIAELKPPKAALIREVIEGLRHDVDENAWAFPGGDELLDALEAVEGSSQLRRNALKSIGIAVEAAGLAAAAMLRTGVRGRSEVWRLLLAGR